MVSPKANFAEGNKVGGYIEIPDKSNNTGAFKNENDENAVSEGQSTTTTKQHQIVDENCCHVKHMKKENKKKETVQYKTLVNEKQFIPLDESLELLSEQQLKKMKDMGIKNQYEALMHSTCQFNSPNEDSQIYRESADSFLGQNCNANEEATTNGTKSDEINFDDYITTARLPKSVFCRKILERNYYLLNHPSPENVRINQMEKFHTQLKALEKELISMMPAQCNRPKETGQNTIIGEHSMTGSDIKEVENNEQTNMQQNSILLEKGCSSSGKFKRPVSLNLSIDINNACLEDEKSQYNEKKCVTQKAKDSITVGSDKCRFVIRKCRVMIKRLKEIGKVPSTKSGMQTVPINRTSQRIKLREVEKKLLTNINNQGQIKKSKYIWSGLDGNVLDVREKHKQKIKNILLPAVEREKVDRAKEKEAEAVIHLLTNEKIEQEGFNINKILEKRDEFLPINDYNGTEINQKKKEVQRSICKERRSEENVKENTRHPKINKELQFCLIFNNKIVKEIDSYLQFKDQLECNMSLDNNQKKCVVEKLNKKERIETAFIDETRQTHECFIQHSRFKKIVSKHKLQNNEKNQMKSSLSKRHINAQVKNQERSSNILTKKVETKNLKRKMCEKSEKSSHVYISLKNVAQESERTETNSENSANTNTELAELKLIDTEAVIKNTSERDNRKSEMHTKKEQNSVLKVDDNKLMKIGQPKKDRKTHELYKEYVKKVQNRNLNLLVLEKMSKNVEENVEQHTKLSGSPKLNEINASTKMVNNKSIENSIITGNGKKSQNDSLATEGKTWRIPLKTRKLTGIESSHVTTFSENCKSYSTDSAISTVFCDPLKVNNDQSLSASGRDSQDNSNTQGYPKSADNPGNVSSVQRLNDSRYSSGFSSVSNIELSQEDFCDFDREFMSMDSKSETNKIFTLTNKLPNYKHKIEFTSTPKQPKQKVEILSDEPYFGGLFCFDFNKGCLTVNIPWTIFEIDLPPYKVNKPDRLEELLFQNKDPRLLRYKDLVSCLSWTSNRLKET